MVVVVACIVAAVVVAMVRPREREPEYKGKKLSEWLVDYGNPWDPTGDKEKRQGAREAMSYFGTNALPWLVRWIPYEEPAWKAKVYFFIAKMPAALQNNFLMAKVNPYRTDRPDELALAGFFVIGEQASPPIPELARLMKDVKAPAFFLQARHCVEFIGEPAHTALSNALEQIGNPVGY